MEAEISETAAQLLTIRRFRMQQLYEAEAQQYVVMQHAAAQATETQRVTLL